MTRMPAASNRTSSGAIAIIGMSGRYPGGANSPDLLWEILASGTDAVSEARGDRWDLGWHHPDPKRQGRIYTRAGGYLDQIDQFDAEFFGLSPREVRQTDPQQRLLLELAWEAHEDAGIAPRSRAGSDTGVFVGISNNDYGSLGGPGWPDAYSNTGSSFSIAANRISYVFDFHGPSVAVDTACSSSVVCMHQACVSLLAGECSTALAGGANLLIDVRPWLGFARASMLSPTGRCRSFDASGDGYVRAEGGGLFLLKRLEDAERDGDCILGVILASGVNSDGRTMGLSMPNREAQEALLRKVYDQCAVAAEDVFYVEAHGTGTSVGDPIECEALGRVLGAPRADGSRCRIGSVKSNIGHLENAAGCAGLAKVLLALRHRRIPANLHFQTPNPKIDFEQWKLDVVAEATPLPDRDRPLVLGLNSFGFGGTNAHLVVQEYRATPRPAARVTVPAIAPRGVLVLSGQSDAALADVARRYVEFLRRDPDQSWPDLCAAAATMRSPLRQRLAVEAGSAAEAAVKLETWLEGQAVARLSTGSCPTPRAPMAFVYSGNGPQWWGMGRELLAEHATFRAEVEAIDAVFAPMAGWSLLDEMRRPEAEHRMALTEVAQPMLFAVQAGLTAALREAGIVPSFVFGHSVGEAAAAYASGALTREQATRVIFHRSQEQGKTAGSGRMAALGVSPDEARALIARTAGWLELAATNSPQSVTIAGDPIVLEGVVQDLTAAGRFARVLQLNYPFHTRAMEPSREPLLAALATLTPGATTVPFVSTVDGTEKAGPELDADYWYRNVREPVTFHEAVSHLLNARGVTVFLEIGPHPVLKDYVLQCARGGDAGVTALPTLRRPGSKGPEPESDNLWAAICACHAAGGSDLERVFARPASRPALPLYPWQRSRHWRGFTQLPDTVAPHEIDHPLLGHRITSGSPLWENTIDVHRVAYLADHVVQDAVVFPAAAYAETVLTAGRLLFGLGTIEIEDFEILRPLAIAGHADPLLQTSVDPADGTFEVRSRPDPFSRDWTAHTRGRVTRRDARPAAEPLNTATIAARLPVAMGAGEHYAAARRRGLAYGPMFQGVQRVLLSSPTAASREALAEIDLPFLQEGGLDGYLAHPALFDSCIQVLVALVAQTDTQNRSTIPVMFGRLTSLAPLTSHLFCHVVLRRESERSVVADFVITDCKGRILLTIEQARCQKVDFRHVASTLTSEWWRPDTRTVALAAPSPLPAPGETHAAVAGEVARIVRNEAREEFYRDIRPRLDRLVAAYAAAAIAAIDPGGQPFDLARLSRAGRVKRDQASLLQRLLRIAEDEGYLVGSKGSWQWNAGRAIERPDELWPELFQRYPRYQAELLLLADAGEGLVNRLRGEATDASSALIDQLHDASPFQAAYNQMARALVERLVATWPVDRPIRVLEIGGAGGGVAAWLLPVLPPQRTDYLFSDAAEAFTARAERRFASHRALRVATLDPAIDFMEQGQPAGYFDLVVVSQAPPAAAAATALLDRAARVMTADAQVIAFETHDDRFSTLALGTPGTRWSEAFSAAGYVDACSLDDAAVCAEGQSPQQSVWLARRPSLPTVVPAASTDARHWMLLVEDEETGPAVAPLVSALVAGGQRVDVRQLVGDGATRAASITEVVRTTPCDGIVYVCGREPEPGSPLAISERRCLSAAVLMQALEAHQQERPCHVTFVTRGAFPTANDGAPHAPEHAALWGIGRVIGNEHPGAGIRLVDVHPAADGSDTAWIAAELLRRDDETEVQIASGIRYVARERRTTAIDESSRRPAQGSDLSHREEAFALDFLPQGGLDSLHLRERARRAPSPNQVEIAVKAAGLNFRDVLWAMGMLPEEAVEHGFSGPTIGMECAGEVVRVGEGVTTLAPGDRVVAFASSCFASHVTTDAGSVARIPETLPFAAAATIPTTFLTAWYGLEYLARLEPGETVLIHGAAGGVGIAAVQIAKLKGATVIGTAGSPRKRRMLELLGVDHALNSRSLDFAEDVRELTGGRGVDVVLNSLAGEAITRSLHCLRPFGRFLEIGKRDLYANSRIGLRPFRNNLSYFGIDADTLLIERPALARRLFHEVIAHVATGALRPLPFQEVPVSRAAEAFRAMQQSRHVGKLVVSLERDRPSALAIARTRPVVRPGVTYLVTGGLGGFGLATAQWLADQGATSLALVGRRGATTDEARDGIARLEARGVTVRAFAADVSDRSAVDAMLATVRREMAPLAGVIHSAAVIEDAPVMKIGAEQMARVLGPKLGGAWHLHEATLTDSLELFVLYSSSSAVIGNPGQGAYVAANLALDALAFARRARHLPALSIGWGAIKDAGFLTRHEAVAGMLKTRSGLDATTAEDALADLGRLSAVGATRVCVARFDLQRLSVMVPGARVPRFLPIVPKDAAASLQGEESLADVLARTPEAGRRDLVLTRVREHAARVMGTSAAQVDVNQSLAELGLDSLMAVELAAALERDLGRPVSVMQMLNAGSLAAIAELVLTMLASAGDAPAPAAAPAAGDGRLQEARA